MGNPTQEHQSAQAAGPAPAVVSDALFCGLCREEAVLSVTFGTIEDLIDKGMLTGPKVLTEGGRKIVYDLRASGFKPTPEETEWAMRAITSQNSKLTGTHSDVRSSDSTQ